jgi:hypothetical protein
MAALTMVFPGYASWPKLNWFPSMSVRRAQVVAEFAEPQSDIGSEPEIFRKAEGCDDGIPTAVPVHPVDASPDQ